jgi:predicted transglutaminase-like cysteine proteinase
MRIGTLGILGILAGILVATNAATAATSEGLPPFMATGGLTAQPIGHFEFCQGHPSECAVISASAARVRITTERWNDLVAINAKVNRTVAPATDMEIYGREEWWAYPGAEGDCEDVALLKRLDLIQKGWPVGSLLITVVKRPNGEGHAVLTVLTDRGDLVLDNLDGRVRLWSETPYAFVKRQSEYNSGQWTAIQDTRAPFVGSTR